MFDIDYILPTAVKLLAINIYDNCRFAPRQFQMQIEKNINLLFRRRQYYYFLCECVYVFLSTESCGVWCVWHMKEWIISVASQAELKTVRKAAVTFQIGDNLQQTAPYWWLNVHRTHSAATVRSWIFINVIKAWWKINSQAQPCKKSYRRAERRLQSLIYLLIKTGSGKTNKSKNPWRQ